MSVRAGWRPLHSLLIRSASPKPTLALAEAPAAMQQRRWGGGGGTRSRGPSNSPPCIYHLRGHCRFGVHCNFSHDTEQAASAALPMHHRQLVHSAAVHAGAAGSNVAPWHFRVMSYNVLADCLAHEHAAELYTSVPRFALEWGWRSGLILREILHHRPDVVCLQEVDHFRQFEEALQPHGYEGVYTKRTGDRRDGLAMFWRADELRPVKQRMIKFNQLGLKDNVAQLVVFQRRGSKGGGAAGSCCSSEASGSSLSGQKRRQDDEVAPRARHMRFDSGSEGEEGGSLGAARRRSGNQPRGAAVAEAAAAVEAITVEDVVDGVGHDASASSLGAVEGSSTQRIEGATEPVDVAEAADSGEPPRLPELLVANIHVLFSPKRGDLKLGQVRTLMEHVDSLCLQRQKRSGRRAAAVVCGDFNSAAGSPIYDFLRSGQLDLSLHDRRKMSGQVEAHGHNWRAMQASFLARQAQQAQQAQQQQQPVMAGVFDASSIEAALEQQQQEEQQQQQQADGDGRWQPAGPGAWPGAAAPLNMDAAVAAMQHPQAAPCVVPPYAPPDEATAHAFSGRGGGKPMRAWTAEDLRLAAGSSLVRNGSGSLVARHPLQLASAYSTLTGSESCWSTAHDKFVGTVDYIWFTPAAGGSTSWQLTPLRVLQPPPLQSLHCSLPSPAWPSDHIALVCDFALQAGAAQQPQQPGKKVPSL